MMRIYTRTKRSASAGFTLIEMIGVMIVISILFAAAVPSVVNLIRTQRSVDERVELPKIAAALKLGMLREQVFPIYENDASVSTDGNDAYWWNLAARHGGGGANEVRYPLGIRPDSEVTRKLYFAKDNWSNQSFFQVTGDGSAWLADPLDPEELRLLLVSTTNPDLSLPDSLDNEDKFNAFWDDWAVGSDGDPASGTWSSYGFSSTDWKGRAAELNVQRIDLRDWLCTVVIENRRAIAEASGADLSSALTSALGFWDRGSVSVSSTNLQDAEFIIQARDTFEDANGKDPYGRTFIDYRSEDLNGNGVFNDGINTPYLDEAKDEIDYNRDGDKLDNDVSEDLDSDGFFDHPAQIYTYVEAVMHTQRGRRIDVTQDATVTISGRRSFDSQPEQSITATLALTNRAPLALLFAPSTDSPLTLSGWGNADDPI
ncbi:MAG: prepilin-type N-terminal cleavage/methylation domain-containing protein, partial [Opitutae bacterium]|nr:prepilin-type N-terminal cleavage/methylation domain-containing protein [Opitutae bacterium]